MSRALRNKAIQCRYFRWVIFLREGHYYADGRSNRVRVGRFSLKTKDEKDAIEALVMLDGRRGVELGLAGPSLVQDQGLPSLSIEEGWKRYETRITRSRFLGGLAASSQKRYRSVFDKFLAFTRRHHVRDWNAVTSQLVESYLDQLAKKGYSHRSLYFEATCLKQFVKWLIKTKQLPETLRLQVEVRRPGVSDRYCYSRAEVDAMIAHCEKCQHLHWLGDIIAALSRTGLRISELLALRWSDVDAAIETISLTDELSSVREGRNLRTLKTTRSRFLPIHTSLKSIFQKLRQRGMATTIFRGPNGKRVNADNVRNALVRKVIKPLAKESPELEASGFCKGRLHSFRHHFCSECATQGVPERVLMEWLGHSDSAMIRHYFHLQESVSKEIMCSIKFNNDPSSRASQI